MKRRVSATLYTQGAVKGRDRRALLLAGQKGLLTTMAPASLAPGQNADRRTSVFMRTKSCNQLLQLGRFRPHEAGLLAVHAEDSCPIAGCMH